MNRILVVGQAPAPGHDRCPPWIHSRSGRRLADIIGVPVAQMLEVVDGANVLPRCPPHGGGITHVDHTTQLLARHLLWHHDHKVIVACGMSVVHALCPDRPPTQLGWHHRTLRDGSRRVLAWFPHPSGASRFWNDRERAKVAADWLRHHTREDVRQWQAARSS